MVHHHLSWEDIVVASRSAQPINNWRSLGI
jgi:hypothetical protein